MEKYIDGEVLNNLSLDFQNNKFNRVLLNHFTKFGINDCVTNFSNLEEGAFDFTIKNKVYDILDQKATGRCWIFAAISCLNTYFIEKYNLKNFNLSQNYIAFYDLLEKSNYFMEVMIKNLHKGIDDRLIFTFLQHPIQDAGQWQMFCNLVEKYGIVPECAMGDTYSSKSTGELIGLLSNLLRNFFVELKCISKNEVNDEITKLKEETLQHIYRCLCISLGIPPKTINVCLKKEMGDNIVENNITPTDFYKKYVDLDLKNDFVAIINAPTSDKKFNERYLIKSLGNVIGGDSVCYYNLDIERIKELTIKQLTDGKPVWFGCDSRNYVDREKGILDLKVSDYSLITGFHDEIDKGMALQSGISSMNHAMVFRGVNIKNGKSDRWFVENSYGKQAGKDGCLMMTDKWFERFVYEVVIEKKYLNDSEMFNLKREPIGLEIWDSIGTLAD